MKRPLLSVLLVSLAVAPVFGDDAPFFCRLDLPKRTSPSGEGIGHVEYGNTGSAPLPAPYIRLTAKKGTLLRFQDVEGWSDALELLAVSESAPTSELKPGERRRVPFRFRASGAEASISCGFTRDNPGPYPWENNGPLMRPSWADDTLWGIAFARLRSGIGESWHDYLVRMRAAADHLFGIGTPECRIDRLWQLEVNEALGVDFALATLASATDLSRDARGLPLSFSRSYGSSLHQRRHAGSLGYGWSDNWDATYSLLSGGDVLEMRSGDGSNARFARIDGKWTPENGFDKASLVETELEWVLKTKDGMTRHVSKIFGRTTSVSDSQGNALSLSYGDKGRLASIRHVDGQTLFFLYGADGLLASATDDQGRAVRYEYENGMLVRVVSWDGLETRYRYLPDDGTATASALRQIVLPDGTTRDFAYDASGRIASVSVNGGRQTVEIVRRPYGSYAVVAPNGAVTEVTVGASGETVRTKDALGRVSTMAYTADGLLSSIVGPTGKSAAISYDAEGRPVRATGPDGAGTSFAYDPASGSLSSVTDARGNAFRFGSDALGRPNRLSYADDTAETIEYGARGDVAAVVNRRGQRISCDYDKQGRPVRETWPDGRVLSWTYDARGNCVRAEDSATGAVAMEYDAFDRLTRIVHPGGRGFAYAYDNLGRIVERAMLGGPSSVSAADGTKTVPPSAADIQRYAYDALGRLARVTDGSGRVQVEIGYDDATGWLVSQRFGNGTSTSYAYDALGRVERISHLGPDGKELAFFAYAYDADGRRISQTTAEGVERYEYDATGQLVGVSYPDGSSESFAYDAVGNRVSSGGSQSSAIATYVVNALNQYVSVRAADGAETRLDYDADGNLVRRTGPDGTVTEYAYDAANRLVSVKSAARDIDWSCTYDVFGNRVRTTDHGRTVERLYVQGALPSVAAEFDAGGGVAARHILVGAFRVASGGAGGSPADFQWYHGDGLASARLTTDGKGAVASTASFKAFGEVRAIGGPDSVPAADGAKTAPPADGWVGTLGVERDPTGLVFMRNRYYDPELGRFIQMDPIGLMAGDVNLYRYCGNDVVAQIDPIGFLSTTTEVEMSERLAQYLNDVMKLERAFKVDKKLGKKILEKIGKKLGSKAAALVTKIIARHVAGLVFLETGPGEAVIQGAFIVWDLWDGLTLLKDVADIILEEIRVNPIPKTNPDPNNPFSPGKPIPKIEPCKPYNPPDNRDHCEKDQDELEKLLKKLKNYDRNFDQIKILYPDQFREGRRSLERQIEILKERLKDCPGFSTNA